MSDEMLPSKTLLKYEQDFCKYCTRSNRYLTSYYQIKDLVKAESETVSSFFLNPSDMSENLRNKVLGLLGQSSDLIQRFVANFYANQGWNSTRFSNQDVNILSVKLFYSIFAAANRELFNEESNRLKEKRNPRVDRE